MGPVLLKMLPFAPGTIAPTIAVSGTDWYILILFGSALRTSRYLAPALGRFHPAM